VNQIKKYRVGGSIGTGILGDGLKPVGPAAGLNNHWCCSDSD
jgi:hypothetical protein